MKKYKMLFAGESWLTHNMEVKGWDDFSVGGYGTEIDRIHAAMDEFAEITHLPSHLVGEKFPSTMEELKTYDVVILSDVGANTLLLHPLVFTQSVRFPNRLQLLADYVEQGGALGMMGGYMTFQVIGGKGCYHGSPIEKALPVDFLPYDDRQEHPEGIDLKVDPQRHPALKGLPEEWPYLLGYNKAVAKPGAQVAVEYQGDPILSTGWCRDDRPERRGGTMKVKVAAIQMSADIGGREANVERAERLLIQAARQGADLCVLPELALDEFFPLYKDTRYFAYAEELDGPTVRRFRSLAGELGIYLALPLFEKSLIGTYYNSLVLLTPEGTIGAVYRKVHVPCTRSYERYYFTPGPEFVVADTRYGKVGLAICYDRRYPETCRELMKKGARLILISISSSIMPGGFSELPVFETELKTRAFENQLFLAACNRSGQEGEYTFFGHSMLLGPDGSVLAQADEAENVVVLAEMELEDADRARINGPLLRDRRPELYTC